MPQKPLLFVLLCLLLAGCVSEEHRLQEERLLFESMMNRAIGQVTYEQTLGTFGPPTDRAETAQTITAVWEDPTANGFRMDGPDSGTGGLSRLRSNRVRMVFDRRTQLMKSWAYPSP